mmetsp:Transcript_49733/g.81838  ORF Transcript_49733/g.81838 Transcript_49733/m.81838 type:complete len:136 (+) Transcript_49733:118-525(+)
MLFAAYVAMVGRRRLVIDYPSLQGLFTSSLVQWGASDRHLARLRAALNRSDLAVQRAQLVLNRFYHPVRFDCDTAAQDVVMLAHNRAVHHTQFPGAGEDGAQHQVMCPWTVHRINPYPRFQECAPHVCPGGCGKG